ncbi:hypothetical protein J3A83DRAFT_4092749, partial [Scleroderma citrinum]
GLVVISHVHYWLCMDLVGESLATFTSSQLLMQAVHDALTAHEVACRAGFVHWDLSPGNIVIFEGHGYLINWDLEKPINFLTTCWITCTVCGTSFFYDCLFIISGQGTLQFMSAHLVKNRAADHTFQDDRVHILCATLDSPPVLPIITIF